MTKLTAHDINEICNNFSFGDLCESTRREVAEICNCIVFDESMAGCRLDDVYIMNDVIWIWYEDEEGNFQSWHYQPKAIFKKGIRTFSKVACNYNSVVFYNGEWSCTFNWYDKVQELEEIPVLNYKYQVLGEDHVRVERVKIPTKYIPMVERAWKCANS